jgi:CSLREA domain-containing protein
MALLPAAAGALTITVSTATDESGIGASCSLREALNAAQNNAAYGGCTTGATGEDSIDFDLPSGTTEVQLDTAGVGYTGTGGEDLTITGPGATALSIVGPATPGPTGRVLYLLNGDISLSGLTITGGKVSGAFDFGGGINFNSPGTLTLNDVHVVDNTVSTSGATTVAGGGGIALSNVGGSLVLDHSVVSGNTATATQNTASGSATAQGGGIYDPGAGGPVQIHFSTVADNHAIANGTVATTSATASGGGIDVSGPNADELAVDHSTISGNQASATNSSATATKAIGGGVMSGAKVTLEQTTVAQNSLVIAGTGAAPATRTQTGGGLELDNSLEVTITSSTIARNGPDPTSAQPTISSANIGSKGVPSPPATLSNTIIADPVGPGSGQCSTGFSALISGGFNTISSVSSCLDTSITGNPTDVIADPLLGDLQDNGGSTETMLPADESPVIDAGSATAGTPADTTHDQRGLLRPYDFTGIADAADGADRGAAEVVGTCAGLAAPGVACPLPPVTPPPVVPGPTGQRAAALKKCKKKKGKKAKKKCKKKAARLPA